MSQNPAPINFVVTLLGQDHIGIVEAFSHAVADHSGTWCESRVLQVDTQFGGVFRAQLPSDQADAFEAALRTEFEGEFQLGVARSQAVDAPQQDGNSFSVRVICSDRQGLVEDFAHMCTERSINIVELQTELQTAAMSGLVLFCINAVAECSSPLDRSEFASAIETLGHDVVVDFVDADRPSDA